jgi:hypothetical protein
MVPPLEGALWVDQDIRHVLHVADLAATAPHFEERVIGRARQTDIPTAITTAANPPDAAMTAPSTKMLGA